MMWGGGEVKDEGVGGGRLGGWGWGWRDGGVVGVWVGVCGCGCVWVCVGVCGCVGEGQDCCCAGALIFEYK